MHTCALRALNLCDGLVLEDPERGPADCPHWVLSDPTAWATHERAEQLLAEGLALVEPELPF